MDSPVEAITRDGDGVFSLLTRQRPVHARFVVNAAGVFADEIARMAGAGSFRIRPRKGEEYLLDKRLRGLVKRIIFPCPTAHSKGILVIPTYDGTLMVGPTAVFVEDKDNRTTSAAGSDEIFAAVRRFAPGISERDCIAEFAGLRAVADGEDFIIGPSEQKGFINCAGIQSPGLTASPAIAERIVAILHDEGLEMTPNPTYRSHIGKRVLFASQSLEDQIPATGASAAAASRSANARSSMPFTPGRARSTASSSAPAPGWAAARGGSVRGGACSCCRLNSVSP